MKKKIKIEEDSTETLNVFQACNHFQLNGRNRRVAEKKYQNSVMIESDWEQILTADKLL